MNCSFRTCALAVLFGTVLQLLAGLTRADAQLPPNINPQFIGRWCVQGDSARNATIAQGPLGLQLTNESGSTSTAQGVGLGGSTIVALEWDLVQGTLRNDGRRIDWTNGTYWNHCSGSGMTLDGTWYAGGDPGRMCSISQQYGAINFVNESAVRASGHFDGPSHLVALWQGKSIGGAVSPDGSRISWDNGTFWSR